jgi:FKBP-type peptidyl-prolyl cis-trans isomerase
MNLRSYSFLYLVALVTVLFAGCTKEYPAIEQQDDEVIRAYIKQNNLSAQPYGDTGIYYQVIKQGNGAALDYGVRTPVVMSVRAINNSFAALDTFAAFNRFSDYFGYLHLKGTQNTETFARLATSAQMKAGGTIRLFIPSKLLFGRNPVSSLSGYKNIELPGNSCLDVSMSFYDAASMDVYDDLSIRNYISANNLTGYTRLSTGTYYKILDAGNSTPITTASIISADYTGMLLDGTVFDMSNGAPATFLLSSLIPGWRDALPNIREGGSIELLVPSSRGYGLHESLGANGAVSIPAFSTLYFRIKVTEVK